MIWPARSAQELRAIAARAQGYVVQPNGTIEAPTPEAAVEISRLITAPKRRSALVKLGAGPIVKRPEVEIDVCPVPTGEGGAW